MIFFIFFLFSDSENGGHQRSPRSRTVHSPRRKTTHFSPGRPYRSLQKKIPLHLRQHKKREIKKFGHRFSVRSEKGQRWLQEAFGMDAQRVRPIRRRRRRHDQFHFFWKSLQIPIRDNSGEGQIFPRNVDRYTKVPYFSVR